MKRNNYVKINTDAILANYRAVCQKTGVPVMAVIKADAYGHGAVQVAHLLEQECPFFGVSSVSEALELRQANIQQPILILGHTPASVFHLLVGQGIRPTIFQVYPIQQAEDAHQLMYSGKSAGKIVLTVDDQD